MYCHLTREERCQISALNKRGISCRSIAADLNRSPSTISRELRRNRGYRGYRHKQANQLAENRRANNARIKLTARLKNLIAEKIGALQWSPEQFSGWLKHQAEYGMTISHERVYQYIWEDKKNGGKLYKSLRHRGKKYNKRKHSNHRRGIIPNRRDIDERPEIVEEKSRLGDWEADTIIGSKHSGALLSLVDRHSKATILAKLPAKRAEDVENAITSRLQELKRFVLTITFDNGMEFAYHEKVAEKLEAQCFFAKPYHSWQRGLNEHTNGLVRQYFPKSTDFAMVTHGKVAKVQWLLNNRPRKVLNFKTPLEIFKLRQNQQINTDVALRC